MTTETGTYDKNTIHSTLVGILGELFEVPSDSITPDTKLYDDLDIDSIDAVDLAVRLQEITGKKLEAAAFKEIRTVGDVVEAVDHLLNGQPNQG